MDLATRMTNKESIEMKQLVINLKKQNSDTFKNIKNIMIDIKNKSVKN